MNIAVTGASGFLGRYLVHALLERGHEVTCFSRSKSKLTEIFSAASPVRFAATDYSIASLEARFQSFDACIHLAAKRYARDSTRLTDYLDNVLHTDNLLGVCQSRGVKQVIVASTISVYSPGHNVAPFSEKKFPFPKNPYGLSKLISEKTACFYQDLRVTSLRFAQLVGWGERTGFMLAAFLQNALQGSPLAVYGAGAGKRDYLYAKDAVAAILKALACAEVTGTFNIGSGRAVSHRDLAYAIVTAFHEKGSTIVLDPSRQEDTSVVCMDISAAEQVLKWSPRYDLVRMLSDMKEDTCAFEQWGKIR